jgi:dihydroorotate dehydrogenase (fumarate)
VPDLSTTYLGLSLRTPLVASASPQHGSVDGVRRVADAGASAVVLPSLFEEQLTHEALDLHELMEAPSESFPEALTYLPEVDDYNTGPDHYLGLIEDAKRAVSIPVIASLNGVSPTGWVRFATLMQEAGADAIELNVYFVAADPALTAADVEVRYLDMVAAVRATVQVPLAVKIGPFFSSVANMALRLVDAGADGLVLFNRFYQADLDIEALEVEPRLTLSAPWEVRLPLVWIGILHGRIRASLAASTGIHGWEEAAKVLLAGADVAMMTSALLHHGPGHIATVEEGLRAWMVEREYESVAQLRGSMSQRAVPDPTAFERGNYMRTLTSYSGHSGDA